VTAAAWVAMRESRILLAGLLPPPTADSIVYANLRSALVGFSGWAAFGVCQGWTLTRDRRETRIWAAALILAALLVALANLVATLPFFGTLAWYWDFVLTLVYTLLIFLGLALATGLLLIRWMRLTRYAPGAQ